jgi:hypothetical protein
VRLAISDHRPHDGGLKRHSLLAAIGRNFTADSLVAFPCDLVTVLISRLLVRLGTLGLLCRRRLALHLLLRILRRGSNVAGCAIHRLCWRMPFRVGSHAGRLTGSSRCWSGTCVLQICSSTGCIAGARHSGAGAQNKCGATRENKSFRVHFLLLRPDARLSARDQGKPRRRPRVPGGRANSAIVKSTHRAQH